MSSVYSLGLGSRFQGLFSRVYVLGSKFLASSDYYIGSSVYGLVSRV